jgi:phosphatidylinositol glycan class H protein
VSPTHPPCSDTQPTAPTESVIALPPHGIQLETHRGFPFLPLFVTRRFIAAASLRDFVITEGLRGWDVRFYLAALAEGHSEPVQLAVAYSVSLLSSISGLR